MGWWRSRSNLRTPSAFRLFKLVPDLFKIATTATNSLSRKVRLIKLISFELALIFFPLLLCRGEYLCPLCRQLANSVLPLSPQYGDKSQMVRARPNESMSQILEEISGFLKDNDQKPVRLRAKLDVRWRCWRDWCFAQSSSSMAEAIGKVMEDMTSSTQIKPLFRPKTDNPFTQSLFLFVTSIARTNLEVELVQRDGSLVISLGDPPNPLLPKRDCIGEFSYYILLFVLLLH